MKNLLIVGAGGHGRIVADSAIAGGRYKQIGFLDDRLDTLKLPGTQSILGPVSAASRFLGEYHSAFVAIGDNPLRLELICKLSKLGFELPTIINPTAYVGSDVTIGMGSVLLANTVVNTGSVLGVGVIVNTGATIDHDNSLGDGVHVSPGAHLAGEVSVGACSWIGTGAAVIPQVKIGSHVMVGAGAVIIHDISDGDTVVGVPGHILCKGSDMKYDNPK